MARAKTRPKTAPDLHTTNTTVTHRPPPRITTPPGPPFLGSFFGCVFAFALFVWYFSWLHPAFANNKHFFSRLRCTSRSFDKCIRSVWLIKLHAKSMSAWNTQGWRACMPCKAMTRRRWPMRVFGAFDSKPTIKSE